MVQSEGFGPLDPEVASALAAVGLGQPNLDVPTNAVLAQLRARAASLPPAVLPDVGARHRHAVATAPDGLHEVAVVVYEPEPSGDGEDGPWPCLFWIYGGGYIFEPTYRVDPRLLQWAAEHRCVVVAPHYRLAPEHPFPAAHDDCRTAADWLFRSADELAVDPSRVVLGGESAGGGLAAGLLLRDRDEGVARFHHQILVYAALDDRHATPSSQVRDTPVWGADLSRFAWDCYLGANHRSRQVSAYAAPGRVTDLHGMPPAFVLVGSNDITRDENLDFVSRLEEAQVPVQLYVYAGAPHAFELIAPEAEVSRQMSRDLDRAVATSLGVSTQQK